MFKDNVIVQASGLWCLKGKKDHHDMNSLIRAKLNSSKHALNLCNSGARFLHSQSPSGLSKQTTPNLALKSLSAGHLEQLSDFRFFFANSDRVICTSLWLVVIERGERPSGFMKCF